MHLTFSPHEVLLDGKDLLKLRAAADFQALFGSPSRQRDIPMHPGGTRIVMVWDELGLVAYEDRPGQLMSHFHLAFSPEHTPEQPQQPCQATIEINGGIVTAEATEHSLPRQGPTPITVDNAKHIFHRANNYSIYFAFERRPDVDRGGIDTGPLQSVSFTWERPRV